MTRYFVRVLGEMTITPPLLPSASAEPTTDVPPRLRMVALVPAHNEAAGVAATIEALLAQTRPFDSIVVIGDNCTDDTVEIARRFPVEVVETVGNRNRKSGALNMAWRHFAGDADIVITVDADTELDAHAAADWEAEFLADDGLAGSTAKFTMRPGRGLVLRWQRFEFATSVDVSLRRGWTAVLAGAGAALRNDALRQVVARGDREGPWSYESTVEDFELTHRLRELGWSCHTSPTIRAFTDPMPTTSALWGQRLKWTSGTAEDLLRFGLNRLTFAAWSQQAAGVLAVLTRALWVVVTIWGFVLGAAGFSPLWLLLPAITISLSVRRALRIPYRDWRDIALAALVIPQETYAWLQVGWFLKAWAVVLTGKLSRRRRDLWAFQYEAERR
jgi:cellulose synthase/poly-beta-1,6-N-acetylglucosamine synthase-like glycosyltransferase